jgi:DAK2 domain fusion protein YloV
MQVLGGNDLYQAFSAGASCLERYRDAVNALNVFPVPDGDTGTNMLLTMRSALEQCPESSNPSAGEVASGLADGAFWGARGNSGVILSQMFRGFADALKGEDVCDAASLSRAFSLSTEAAYRSVSQPVEGTMLSVMRAASEATALAAADGDTDALSLWESVFRSATNALYETPRQLPVLMEAGVVDAGGLGVVVILGGAFAFLNGEGEALVDQVVAACCAGSGGTAVAGAPETQASIHTDFWDASLESRWGYCIQYVIDAGGPVAGEVSAALEGDRERSAVVIGDGRFVRVHVHAQDPGPALSLGVSYGPLDQIKIENMSQQNSQFVAGRQSAKAASTRMAVVAVAQGEGLAGLFRDTGCAEVIDGGQTMNPSVGQILAAASSTGGEDVIILPNNSNIVGAARQAASANQNLHVVPSKTTPQGVAALLAYSPENTLEHNLKAMSAALDGVVTVEVTQAVRSSAIGGIEVTEGRFIGLLDGELVTSEDGPESALMAVLDRIGFSPDQIITIYPGELASGEAAEEMRRRLLAGAPDLQVDMVYGGQPHYHYLASLE